MFTFFRGKMLSLNLVILLIGIFLNYMVINYLINYPLNPVKLSGYEGKKGTFGFKGDKGGLGVLGPGGQIGNSGPIGEAGKKGFVGMRGQLYKFGKTTNDCMNDPNCRWGEPDPEWLNIVDSLKNNPSRISSTFRYRQGNAEQDNLKDFFRGNTPAIKNIVNTEPTVQLRPCITCEHCDPPAPWDDILGNPYLQ